MLTCRPNLHNTDDYKPTNNFKSGFDTSPLQCAANKPRIMQAQWISHTDVARTGLKQPTLATKPMNKGRNGM
jgi:hypothetical protein